MSLWLARRKSADGGEGGQEKKKIRPDNEYESGGHSAEWLAPSIFPVVTVCLPVLSKPVARPRRR